VFVKRTMKRKFPTMSVWTNEDFMKRTEDEDRINNLGRCVVEPPLDVPRPTEAKQHSTKDNRRSGIEVVKKKYSSLLHKCVRHPC